VRGMERENTICGNCGKAINQETSWQVKRFCCDKCRLMYWANHKEGLNKKAYYDYICHECGESFQAYGNDHRKYCSRACYGRAKTGSKVQIPVPKEEIVENKRSASTTAKRPIVAKQKPLLPEYDPTVFPQEEAIRLHKSGIGYKKIGKVLGVSRNTVSSWIRRYGDGTARYIWRSGLSTQNCRIRTMDDWLTILSLAAENFQCVDSETATRGLPAIIVCGAVAVNKGADILSTIIKYQLQMDPFSGEIYVFCGKSRDRVCFICWDGSGFQVVKRRKEHGTYFWPPQRLGATITVSAREFEYILRGCERR